MLDDDDDDDKGSGKKSSSDEDFLEDALECFERTAEAENDNRIEALDDLRFARLGEQWPAAMLRQRNLENRPALTINKLPAFIRQVVNDARQNKPSIKVHPVDDHADPAVAKVIDGLIRNIEYTSSADIAYDTATEHAVSMGFGYIRVATDYTHDDSFDLDICIDRVANPFSIYGDPDSQAADSSDWNTAFVIEDMPKDSFRRKYKGKKAVDWEGSGYQQIKRPEWWSSSHVRVAEYWVREEVPTKFLMMSDGTVLNEDTYKAQLDYYQAMMIRPVQERNGVTHEVTQHILTGAEKLSSTKWIGKFIPIVPVYGDEVNVEGKRYLRSLIRDAKDPQRMFNYWRTTATELVALAPKAPWLVAKGSIDDDMQRWQNAHTQSYPYLEYDPNKGPPPQRQPFTGPPAAALQEAMNSSDDMKAIMGMYDASLGQRSNETSGRAILARQREGDVSNFHFQDNMTRAIRHVGRIVLDLIPKVYTKDRMIRVLGEDGTPTIAQLSSNTTGAVQEVQDPRGEAIGHVFNLNVGKYDLTVEAGPSFTTRREEAANQMMQLLQAFPAAAPVIGDLVAKNLDWPGADEIAERLKAVSPIAQQEAGPPPPTPADQIKMIAEQNKAEQARANTAATQAKTELDGRRVAIDAFKAVTERLQTEQASMTPEQIQALIMQTIRQAMGQAI